MNYFGHVIKPWRLEVSSYTIEAICSLQKPSSVTKFCSFFSLCNFFQQFVPNFAQTTTLLKRKLREDQPPEYTKLSYKELEPIKSLKMLILLPLLAFLRSQGTCTVYSVACELQEGFHFLQKQPNRHNKIFNH